MSKNAVISHYFREKFPYHVNHRDTQSNLARSAEVWLGEQYIDKFYSEIGVRRGSLNYGDISSNFHNKIVEQKEFKKRMNCKPFSWFVEKFMDITPCEKGKCP